MPLLLSDSHTNVLQPQTCHLVRPCVFVVLPATPMSLGSRPRFELELKYIDVAGNTKDKRHRGVTDRQQQG